MMGLFYSCGARILFRVKDTRWNPTSCTKKKIFLSLCKIMVDNQYQIFKTHKGKILIHKVLDRTRGGGG